MHQQEYSKLSSLALAQEQEKREEQEDGMDLMNSQRASGLDCTQVRHDLNTDTHQGLTTGEVLVRQKQYGLNEFDLGEETPLWRKYLDQFKEPMIVLLLVSGAVSICMGQYDDAISITVAVLIVVTVAFIQEYRSDKSVEAITKLVPPSCRCLRDGEWMEFLAKELVVGDIIQIQTGDRVPADLRLFEAIHLEIDESSFTGEIEPAKKHTKMLEKNTVASDRSNVALMGTLVRCGNGKGIVYGTGVSSEFGSIFQMMREEEPPKTPLQKSMDQLGKQLSCYSIIIIGLIVLLGWAQKRKILEMLTVGVSLAVAAIPEGLPIVVTVTLALGVMRMARRNAIVRKLPVVETLGCATVVCSDKTGTLTKNEMTVTDITLADFRTVEVTGVGYHGHGELLLNGKAVTEWTDLPLTMLVKTGCICNNAAVKAGQLFGQATDGAIITLGLKLGLVRINEEYERLDEIPFSSEKKYMAIKCRKRWSSSEEQELYHVKGAPEKILTMCSHYQKESSVVALTNEHRENTLQRVREMGGRALRVVGLCRGEKLSEMTFLGLVGIIDPPRPGVAKAIATLADSGVDVKMITGDSRETASAICLKIGLNSEPKRLLSGEQMDSMDYMDLKRLINEISVFYRVSPKNKVTIVKALQECDHVVAMTGDGVNDAVALKRADIGIAMGRSGTDVSKEAADMILADDDFSTILVALGEGKGIYFNIRNFVCFQLSTSIAAISLITISTILELQNPLNAMQILWINIIMDGPPAQSLGVEPVDDDIMKRKPRAVRSAMIDRYLLMRVLMSAILIVLGTLFIFWREMSDNIVTPRDTTMTFTCFVFFDMFNALSCRSQNKSIFQIGLFTNRMFLYAVGGSLIGQMLVVYFPPLQRVFQTEALTFIDILCLICIASTVFIVDEIRKLCIRIILNRKQRYRRLSSISLV